MTPTLFRRTCTMKESARLAEYLTPGDPLAVMAEGAGLRGVQGTVAEDDDNMPDPYHETIHHAKGIASQVIDTGHATIRALGLWSDGLAGTAPAFTVAPSEVSRRPRPHRSD